MLNNELVVITYLNEDWQDEYGSELELWSKDKDAIVRSIAPIMGRTVIMKHTPWSFHGHTKPLNTGGKTVRRSVASYYYTNQATIWKRLDYRNSLFATDQKGAMTTYGITREAAAGYKQNLGYIARICTPPVIWKYLSLTLRKRRSQGVGA
jgi:hypothetical protein